MSFIYPNYLTIRAFSKPKALKKILKQENVTEEDYICKVYTETELLNLGIKSSCQKFLESTESKKDKELKKKILSCQRKKINGTGFYDYLGRKTDTELIHLCSMATHFGIIFIRQLNYKDIEHPVYKILVDAIATSLENAPTAISNLMHVDNRENLINTIVNFYLEAKKFEDLWHEIPHSYGIKIISQEIFNPKYMNLFDQTN